MLQLPEPAKGRVVKFTKAELDDRAAMNDVVELMVRDVFLDSPEGTDSVTVAANVTRTLWSAGYRKVSA